MPAAANAIVAARARLISVLASRELRMLMPFPFDCCSRAGEVARRAADRWEPVATSARLTHHAGDMLVASCCVAAFLAANRARARFGRPRRHCPRSDRAQTAFIWVEEWRTRSATRGSASCRQDRAIRDKAEQAADLLCAYECRPKRLRKETLYETGTIRGLDQTSRRPLPAIDAGDGCCRRPVGRGGLFPCGIGA